ncbi:MAG: PilZ domain-containing protein [Chloroflexi bacterium]|nr:PilZ domain-containing protein [Chloroflexota bacterium]
MSSPNEQRRHARAPVSLFGSITDPEGQQHPIVVLDLSRGGALIQTNEPPRDGAEYQVGFTVHRKAYEVPVEVVGSLQLKDAWGWRCRFVHIDEGQAQALERAVHATLGTATHVMRPWTEIRAEAEASMDTSMVVGHTPAGHDISVTGKDALEMGEQGMELYVQMVSELERM